MTTIFVAILAELSPGATIQQSLSNHARDITGQRFGRLTALAPTSLRCGSSVKWLCACDCGNYTLASVQHLGSGNVQSCGCLRHETAVRNGHLRFPTLSHGEAAFNRLLHTYKANATRRNLGWGLTADEFRKLTSMPCHYCGVAPAQTARPAGKTDTGSYIYNGLDRKDNGRGYTPDNVVPCCKECNFIKHDRNYKEFIAWIKQVYEHLLGATDGS